MKKYTLIIVLALAALPFLGFEKKNAAQKTMNPANIIFCWDIHDTLLKQNKHEKFHSTVERDLHLAQLPDAHIKYTELLDKYGFCAGVHAEDECQKQAQEYLNKAAAAQKAGDKVKATECRKTAENLLKLIKSFHKFELSYEHNDGIIELLEKLKKAGYTNHHVASNIAERHYDLVKGKFSTIFNNAMVKDGLIIDVHASPHIRKPHGDYFAQLNTKFNPQGDKILVFIDDKAKNVETACNAGFIGVQIKNVEQLTGEFEKLGIKTA